MGGGWGAAVMEMGCIGEDGGIHILHYWENKMHDISV